MLKNDCENYELSVFRGRLNNSKDVIECKAAYDYPPFDGGEYYENHGYRWFKPLNERGVELLNRAFPSSFTKLGDDSVDDWHCVEYTDYDNECWWHGLSACRRYANELQDILDPFNRNERN